MNSETELTYSNGYVPLPIKLLNKIASGSTARFGRFNRLDARNLLRTARYKTGLSDWGDSRVKEALTALVESVIQEGNLTLFGRFTMRKFLLENLSSRLRIIDVLKRFPEIRQQKIHRPIFITGWYRSGTTFFHNLFASHPTLRAPLFWELRYPCPGLEPQTVAPRHVIRKVNLQTKIHRYLAPGFSKAHRMDPLKPEECLHLFEKACAGTTAFFITEAKSFAWWLLDHGMQQGYEFYKAQLQLLSWLRPAKRWIVKWPYHLWHIDTLLKTFPDAIVIILHRDPREAIPSVCSLAALARASFCESIDTAALGRFWLDYSEAGLQRSEMARKNARADQIIDINYPELTKDPQSVMQYMLNQIDLSTDKPWFNSLGIDLKMKEAKQKQHQYALSQFGLSAVKIRARFAEYIEKYDLSST